MAKNVPKSYQCHHMQSIFTQKWQKTVKIRKFQDTKLPLNDSKQKSPVSDQIKCKEKLIFRQKLSVLGPKKGKKLAHFLSEVEFSLSIFKQ